MIANGRYCIAHWRFSHQGTITAYSIPISIRGSHTEFNASDKKSHLPGQEENQTGINVSSTVVCQKCLL